MTTFTFAVKEDVGRTLYTHGRPVLSCEVTNDDGEVIAGGDITINRGTLAAYPELLDHYVDAVIRAAVKDLLEVRRRARATKPPTEGESS